MGAEAAAEVNSGKVAVAGGGATAASPGSTAGGREAAGGKVSGGGFGAKGTSVREWYVVLGKFHSERWNPVRSGEGSSGGVRALRGRGEAVNIRGTRVPGPEEPTGGPTGQSRGQGGSGGGVGSAGGSGSARPAMGSGTTGKAGGSINTFGLGGRGGAGRMGTGGRSESKASSSIPMIKRASCRREARTETYFRVRRRLTSRVEFRCDAEEIVHRTW